jgi:methyltransferase (TIGR00027 family)
MQNNIAITDVSDTALWVAALRAREGKRTNAVFQDPLASILAGVRGEKIARSFANSAGVEWAVVIRTSALDLLIKEALQLGVDTVINMGAGLDTRPYRMTLPKDIRWIEIDFPKLVELKDSALTGHTPSCAVERIGLNLLDRSARNALFTRIGSRSRKVMLIAEGVIPYFSNKDAEILAKDLLAIASFHHWVLDFDNAGTRKMPKSWAKRLQAAPFLFQVQDWFKFFEECGWQGRRVVTSAEESERLDRPYPCSFPTGLLMRMLPREMSRRILTVSGAVLLHRCDQHADQVK